VGLTILLFLLPLCIILLPLLLGLISPEEYSATVTGVIDAPPDEVFRRIEDVEQNPGSGAMARGVEMLPEQHRRGLYRAGRPAAPGEDRPGPSRGSRSRRRGGAVRPLSLPPHPPFRGPRAPSRGVRTHRGPGPPPNTR
jgi:hypothetical protein